jgi:hypothetical protein
VESDHRPAALDDETRQQLATYLGHSRLLVLIGIASVATDALLFVVASFPIAYGAGVVLQPGGLICIIIGAGGMGRSREQRQCLSTSTWRRHECIVVGESYSFVARQLPSDTRPVRVVTDTSLHGRLVSSGLATASVLEVAGNPHHFVVLSLDPPLTMG